MNFERLVSGLSRSSFLKELQKLIQEHFQIIEKILS